MTGDPFLLGYEKGYWDRDKDHAKGVVPAPDVEAAWAVIDTYAPDVRVDAPTYLDWLRAKGVIRAALRGSGARPEPESYVRGHWDGLNCEANGFGGRLSECEHVGRIYEPKVGARPEEGLRAAQIEAAVAAFYEAHINRVYHSAKGRRENLTPVARRDGERAWRPVVEAALRAALSSKVGAIPEEDPRADAAEEVAAMDEVEDHERGGSDG